MNPMKRRLAGFLAFCMILSLLSGCGGGEAPPETVEQTIPETTQATEPPIVYGDPDQVTYKSRYSGEPDMDQKVASVGDVVLTNRLLQAWYWGAVASYRNGDAAEKPDFSQPLEYQSCPLDDSVDTWQQFFLKKALENWHGVQALIAVSKALPLPVEEAFAPIENFREDNMVDIPAMKYLYREEKLYKPNTMHQKYLDEIPALLDTIAAEYGYKDGAQMSQVAFGTDQKSLEDMVWQYNLAYMYATEMGYYTENTQDEVESWFAEYAQTYEDQGIRKDSGHYVDFRQIMLIPKETQELPELAVQVGEDGKVTCEEELWALCEAEAQKLVKSWRNSGRPWSELIFADLAHSNSEDTGTAPDGGAFRRVEKGQMTAPIDDWCFAEDRKKGDYTILRTEYGVHILYYIGAEDIWYAQSEEDLKDHKQRQLLLDARAQYPMEVFYPQITLAPAEEGVEMEAFLYEDVAHERYPEIPLYLQQDYPYSKYGEYLLRSHGCGITSMAMLTTYMMDEEWTPPEMAKKYGHYNTLHGTDVTLFFYEPAAMGYYSSYTRSADEVHQALEEGYPVICLQTKGYWTGGGHYIVLEKLNEDGTIQVRDSNVFNYGKLEGHKEDKHTWESVYTHAKGYWIMDKKLTRPPLCSRCGDCPDVTARLMQGAYICHRCRPALNRRDTYLSMVG